MTFARKYEYFEVRQMLKDAEGVASPVTGAGAHSRTLHAQATPGGEGVTLAQMVDRTHKRPGESNNQFKNRDGVGTTSAFKNLLQQGSAACEALNSTAGQAALATFDSVTWQGDNLRLVMTIPISREMGFLPESGAPSLLVSTKTQGAVDKTQDTSGVRLIIDRAAGATTMHIQTCIPMGSPAPAANWNTSQMPSKTQVASG